MINNALLNVSFRSVSSHFASLSPHWLPISSKMKFDNVLSEINGFGKFQVKMFLIQMLSRITLPCHFLLDNFMGAVPPHHCNISTLDDGGIFGNLTPYQQLLVSIPTEQDGTLSSCQMFAKPQYEYLSGNRTEQESFVECQSGWVYDNSDFKSTLVTEVSVVEKAIR